jgi:hypothetical protein
MRTVVAYANGLTSACIFITSMAIHPTQLTTILLCYASRIMIAITGLHLIQRQQTT